ncbi:MAG: hypothetical protein Q8M22_14640 [Actinomycetota bacterium]|nr:hypothetical protein [Actinomycetota bacterium]
MNTSTAVTPRSFLWALRVCTVALAAAMALAIADAGEQRTSWAGNVAIAAWAVLVCAVVISEVVPGPVGLTVVRVVLPLAVPAAVAALVLGAPLWGTVALALSLLATLVALSAETAEAFAQAAAYGDERRLPLRVPAALLLPMGLSWLVWCALTLAAVLLVGAQQWPLGLLSAVAAGALGWLLGRRFHRFSRRWLVLVPAGVVVHDHVALGETLLIPRANVALARLAPANTQAADFTGPAAGHAVEISVREMVLAVLPATAAEPKGKALHVQSLLVAPLRPGRALRALAGANVPVE